MIVDDAAVVTIANAVGDTDAVTLLLAVVVGDAVGVALGLAMATNLPVLEPMYTEPSAPAESQASLHNSKHNNIKGASSQQQASTKPWNTCIAHLKLCHQQ